MKARTAEPLIAALLIFDEVQTGVGITGKMWAYQHFGVDLVAAVAALPSLPERHRRRGRRGPRSPR